jgi:hypothetical protein
MTPFLQAPCVALLALAVCTSSRAQDVPAGSGPIAPIDLPAGLIDDLSARFKEGLLQHLPADLVLEHNYNWGHQAQVPSVQGVKPIQVQRNHGNWEKATVLARAVPRTLRLRAWALSSPAPQRITFHVYVTIPASARLEKQVWQNGMEVFGSRLRARFELAADLQLEAELNAEAGMTATLDGVATLEVTRATVSSQGFVAENVNGLGGDLARWTGGSAQSFFKPWQPSVLEMLQKTLIGAAESACKAQEVRSSVSKLGFQVAHARAVMVQAQNASPPHHADDPRQAAQTGLSFSLELGLMVEVPVREHHEHLSSPRPARSSVHEHWGLAEHSVHFEHSRSLSDAISPHHLEPTHHK